MAEASKDELLQLIKRFGAYLTVKFSNLFSTLSNMVSISLSPCFAFDIDAEFFMDLIVTLHVFDCSMH